MEREVPRPAPRAGREAALPAALRRTAFLTRGLAGARRAVVVVRLRGSDLALRFAPPAALRAARSRLPPVPGCAAAVGASTPRS